MKSRSAVLGPHYEAIDNTGKSNIKMG